MVDKHRLHLRICRGKAPVGYIIKFISIITASEAKTFKKFKKLKFSQSKYEKIKK